jgi:hypothetical protein
MPDAHKNFAYSTVATAPSPATTGTSLVVAAGTGALFPTAPFNATIWPTAVNPTSSNAEIVRVTAISTDTLTITRQQESTSARTVVVGDQIAATITNKVITDTESFKWAGKVAGAMGNGDPGHLMNHVQMSGWIGPTPTAITTSVARISFFTLPFDLVVNKIRFFGIGITTSVYRVALYNGTTFARLMAETALTTAASAWGAAGSALNVSLLKDQLYFLAVSVNATGATAGLAAVGTTATSTTGTIGVASTGWPGNLDTDLGYMNGGWGQFAVTTGALPDPCATIAAQSAWTGGFPAFWLDNNNA